VSVMREQILKMREEGLSQRQIGGRVGVSSERVRQILFGRKQENNSLLEDLLLSTGDVARLLGIHANTVRRWSRNGVLKTFRVGPRGDRRFRQTDVFNLLR
jgi:excisionase family DNA binding protein